MRSFFHPSTSLKSSWNEMDLFPKRGKSELCFLALAKLLKDGALLIAFKKSLGLFWVLEIQNGEKHAVC